MKTNGQTFGAKAIWISDLVRNRMKRGAVDSFQAGNAALQNFLAGRNCAFQPYFQSGNIMLQFSFQGGNATLQLSFQGGNATLHTIVFSGWTCTDMQMYRQACSKGIVHNQPGQLL